MELDWECYWDVDPIEAMDVRNKLASKDVTKSHYIQRTDTGKCKNEGCGTSFQYPSLRRPHHCRRCGEIFCRDCLTNKRRLNIMAQPDPLGVLCKVCPRCYANRGMDIGCTRRCRTQEFVEMRQTHKKEIEDLKAELTIQTRKGSFGPVCWREQMKVDIFKECKRLLEGYKHSTENSETVNQIHHFTSHIKIPSWEKSTFWKLESHTLTCRECGVHVPSRHDIKNCKVCGFAMCKSCAHKELLLYYDDDARHDNTVTPRLAIIKVKGSPEIEPRVSMLLHCCSRCRSEISELQTEDEEWYREKPKPPDFVEEFGTLDGTLRKLSEDITSDIEKLSLEVFEQHEECVEQNESVYINLKQSSTITHLKERLGQAIETYYQHCSALKSLICEHADRIHGSLLPFTKNYLHAKCNFYIDSKHRFHEIIRN